MKIKICVRICKSVSLPVTQHAINFHSYTQYFFSVFLLCSDFLEKIIQNVFASFFAEHLSDKKRANKNCQIRIGDLFYSLFKMISNYLGSKDIRNT